MRTERREEGLARLLSYVSSALRDKGYSVDEVKYPINHGRRSIDVVASSSDGQVVVKVARSLDDVKPSDIAELNMYSRLYDVSSIVVVESGIDEEFDDIVAYEKGLVHIVGVRGFVSALRNGIYVVKRQTNYYMQIDGEKLREERLRRGMSLGDVADIAGVSRKSVYLYEQESMDVSLPTALRLLEVFGEEIFKSYPILKPPSKRSPELSRPSGRSTTFNINEMAESALYRKVIKVLSELGGIFAKVKRSPPHIIASVGDKRLALVLETRREQEVRYRVGEAAKIGRAVSAHVIAVVSSGDRKQEIEKEFGEVEVYRAGELEAKNFEKSL